MFNKNLDKITQAEVVYDFVERLSIGKDLSLAANKNDKYNKPVFKAQTIFLNIIKSILNILPSWLVFNSNKIIKYTIEIPKGYVGMEFKTIFTNMMGSVDKEYELISANSRMCGFDVKNMFSFEYDDMLRSYMLSYGCDTPYPCDEVIDIYFREI